MPLLPTRPRSEPSTTAGRDARSPRHSRRSLGQSMVEFALVLPVMLFLMSIAIDFGRLFYAYVAVENAAKEGALYGSRNPLCVDSNSNVACPDPINVEWHVQKEASNLTTSGGQSLLDTQISCHAPDGHVRQPINDCVNGDTYIVGVSYDFKLVTPILSSVLGDGMTLASTSQAAVIGNAFDPSGIEALVWASTTGSDNAAQITAPAPDGCTLAEATSPTFYYAPCQQSLNQNLYLEFQESQPITFKVRIRNSGNIPLTNLGYSFRVNGFGISAPAACSSLATSMAIGAPASYCTFTLPAIATGTSVDDMVVSIVANGQAAGVPTGDTSGVATVKVVPRPKFTVDLKAAAYRLGGSGGGTGTPQYAASYPTGNLALNINASSSLDEIKSPTGWLWLSVTNSGGEASNFTVGATRGGTALDLAALGCPSATSLATGVTYNCLFPQSFTTTGSFAFAATAVATNSQTIGGQTSVTVTTSACTGSQLVVPNLVDTLPPSVPRTNKTVAQTAGTWSGAGFSTTPTTSPVSPPASNFVLTQTARAYSCSAANTNVSTTNGGTQP